MVKIYPGNKQRLITAAIDIQCVTVKKKLPNILIISKY